MFITLQMEREGYNFHNILQLTSRTIGIPDLPKLIQLFVLCGASMVSLRKWRTTGTKFVRSAAGDTRDLGSTKTLHSWGATTFPIIKL